MNPGGRVCCEQRLFHCTPALATERDSISKKKKSHKMRRFKEETGKGNSTDGTHDAIGNRDVGVWEQFSFSQIKCGQMRHSVYFKDLIGYQYVHRHFQFSPTACVVFPTKGKKHLPVEVTKRNSYGGQESFPLCLP